MAGADYLKCEICGERIMYEPERDPEIKVVCMACYAGVKSDIPALKLLENHLLHGYEMKHQDGKWWLFRSDGKGVAYGESIQKLLVNLIFFEC